MRLPPHLSIRDGHLHIGEHDCMRFAEELGTPLFVTDGARIRDNYRRYYRALSDYYPDVRVLYAAKANGNPAILTMLAREGAGADVFSAGELELAIMAGMNPTQLLFNGNSKSPGDLALAVAMGVRVSVDSIDELHQLDRAAEEAGEDVEIAIRVNPALDVPTHPKIATGLAKSKFGIAHQKIPEAYREALACNHVVPVGLHCHIGSQILEMEPFARAAEVMVRIAGELEEMGISLQFIDLGGGLGIPYHRSDDPEPTPEDYAAEVMPVFLQGIVDAGIMPELWVEPGRYLVGDSTVLLTGVNSVKPAAKTFVNVDAGFNLLVRPVMYDAYHEVIVANRADEAPVGTFTIAGPICETGDLLATDRALPAIRSGDVIAVLDAGAYGFAMSSQYNCRPRCPEVFVDGPQAALMRCRETLDDVLSTTVTPPWFMD